MSDDFNDTPNYSSDVSRLTLKSQIADKLSALIASKMIEEGEALPSERELAKSYDVSRETIRGALGILSERKLITVSQQVRRGRAARLLEVTNRVARVPTARVDLS